MTAIAEPITMSEERLEDYEPMPVDAFPDPGEYLRHKREAMGLSIDDVLKELKDEDPDISLDRPRLFRIEKGERPMPDWLFGAYIRALRRVARRHAVAVGLKIQQEDPEPK